MSDDKKPDNLVKLKPRGKAARYGAAGGGVLARAREILEMHLPPDHELRVEAKKFARWGMLNDEWHENARIGAGRLLAELVGAAQAGETGDLTREEWAEVERHAAEQKARVAG